jgi:dipeptidyl aminopeptidase/acylaminoacyl peptidase
MRHWILLLIAAAALAGAGRPVSHQDIWKVKRLGEAAVSPDGKWLVYAVTEPDYDPAKTAADLWLMPADGSSPARRLTNTRGAESDIAFSPDGKQIAFTARREGDDAPQVYILPLDGGEARRVTSLPNGVSNPQWRPDGKALLFESAFDPIAMQRKERKWNARVYDTFPIRYWNAWLDEKRPHIFTLDLTNPAAKPVDLLDGAALASSRGFAGRFNPLAGGQALEAVWSPDGASVVFTAVVNLDELMYAETESHIFSVTASGGEPRLLTERGQSFASPRFSPKGELFAEHTRIPTRTRIYSLSRLARLSWPQPGKAVILTQAWDRSVSSFEFSLDGATIYIDAEDSGFDNIFSMPAAGGTPAPLLEVSRGGYTNPQATAYGLVAKYQTSAQPPELVQLKPGSNVHAYLTRLNLDQLRELDTPEPVHFWFTAKNGRRIHNLLILPPGHDPAKKYPIVIFPHGGPNSMSKDAFSTRWNSHLLASPGYFVLQTNYTGSTGFGERFADGIERDVLRGPAQEILEAINEAAKRYPSIDLTRQAAAGASYGGYLMNWLNGHTTQFKCFVNHAGAVNNESQYGTNDGGLQRELRMGGPIWEKGGQWNDQSPIRYAGNFKTPMLITQGELDFRVPLSESMTTFKLLQRLKVPTRLVLFPDEGHWILKGENSRKHMDEVLNWLGRYLQ